MRKDHAVLSQFVNTVLINLITNCSRKHASNWLEDMQSRSSVAAHWHIRGHQTPDRDSPNNLPISQGRKQKICLGFTEQVWNLIIWHGTQKQSMSFYSCTWKWNKKEKKRNKKEKVLVFLQKKKKGLKGLFCLILNSSDVINVTHWNNKKNHEGNKCNNFKRQTLSRRADSGLLSAEGNPEDLLRLVSRLLQSGVLGQQHLHCRQEETEQTGWKGQLCPGMPFATQ